jgi:hypothetical protein
MKLIKRLLTGVSSIALGLGISGANAAVGNSDHVDLPGGKSGIEIDVAKDELAALILEDVAQDELRYQVASRFKASGEKGRPAIFGEPGPPVIGPPGRSGY